MLHLNKIQKEDHLYAAFSYFDKDGSGYITPDELQQACEQFGLEDVHLEEIIREVDQDNVMSILAKLLSLKKNELQTFKQIIGLYIMCKYSGDFPGWAHRLQ